jgi:hypothetical protein
MTINKKKIVRKTVTTRGKATPCHACFRPCDNEDDTYCYDCVQSGDAQWHAEMIAKWQAELEAKEELS